MLQFQEYKPIKSQLEILLTGDEIAKILNVSRSFAYLLMKSGQIPTVRLGRSCRVRPQDLSDFIEQNLSQKVNNQ
jgi:excisionase family DNA binding protein